MLERDIEIEVQAGVRMLMIPVVGIPNGKYHMTLTLIDRPPMTIKWRNLPAHVPPESWDVWTWGPYSGVTLATYTGGRFIDAHGRDDGEGLNILEIPDVECWMVVEEPESPM